MNKEELKDEFELDIEFEVDKNNRVDMNQVIELVIAYNKLFRTYKQLKTQIDELQQENKQLKYNWNKLKIWLEEYNIANEKWYSNELSNHDRVYYKKDYLDCKFFINKFIDKMQELEQGSDSNE